MSSAMLQFSLQEIPLGENDKLQAKILSNWGNTAAQSVLIKMGLCPPGRRHLSTGMFRNALQHFNQYFEERKRSKANHSIRSVEAKRLGGQQNQGHNGTVMS